MVTHYYTYYMSLFDVTIDILSANIGLIAVFFVSFWFLFVYLPRKPKCFPPGPKGLPILGVALSLGRRPERIFQKWAKEYGDVIGFKVGTSYTVVLNSYESIQDALVKYGPAFGSRPNNLLFTEGLRKSGISGSDYSHEYMVQRNFAKGALGKLGFGKTFLEEPILDEARYLVESIGEGKVEFNSEVKKKILFANGNVIARVSFGERFDSSDNPDFVTILSAWNTFFRTSAPAFQAAMISPYLLYLPILHQSAMSLKMGLDKHMEIIKHRFKTHREKLDLNDPKDFIDELIIEQKKNGTDKLYTEKMLECMVRDTFGGGLETVELTLIFSVLLLANRPHILKKVQDEIDTVIGSTGKARYALREKMPYTHAVIKEVMRFRTVAPMLVPHAVHENVKFKGYEIPKGTTIFPNIYAVHFNEEYWDKPEEFNPERFINDEGKVQTPKYFMSFGLGPRLCIGRSLAEMEVFILFTTILQHYDVVPIPKPGCERPWVFDDAESVGLTVCPPSETSVYLVTRHTDNQ